MDGELQHGFEHLGISVDRTGGDSIDPTVDRWLVMPAQALPAEHAARPDDPDRPGWVTLDDRSIEHTGQDDKIALGAGGAVEHHPLVRSVRATQEPTRKTVGEPPSGVKRLLIDRPPGDAELRVGRPRGRIGHWLEDRAAARDSPLVNRRAKRVVDLAHQQVTEGLGPSRR